MQPNDANDSRNPFRQLSQEQHTDLVLKLGLSPATLKRWLIGKPEEVKRILLVHYEAGEMYEHCQVIRDSMRP